MVDAFTARYGDLLTGTYDCVDRIVLKAFFPLGYGAGGLRTWWRGLHGDDADLDDAHLMRMAGRFARRVKAWGNANGVPVIFCKAGERKHRIAEDYLATHSVGTGVFLVLAAKAPALVWKVKRAASTGTIVNIERRTEYVNHYSFHILDPRWGHVTIRMSGHPPFGALVMLNGHEYVACGAARAGVGFVKEGNCFTAVADPAGLAQIADALSHDAAVGRLSQVCESWIYTACLCFGLDLDEQRRSRFRYLFSVYQIEYSRNLIFADGQMMEKLFDTVVDRTRSRLDVPKVRTIFGAKHRPHRTRRGSSRIEAAIETPVYGLTVFKLDFGRLTGKAYTKGERVLRFEAIAHNTAELRCGRMLDKFPEIVTRLAAVAERFCDSLDCVDTGFLGDGILDQLPTPSTLGASRVGGVDLNRVRIRDALTAALALTPAPNGFTVGELTAKVHTMTGQTSYSIRQAAYDLRKLRGKQLVDKPGRSRRYTVAPQAARTIAALLTLRDHVIAPILAGVRSPRMGRKPKVWTAIDRHYEQLRVDLQQLFTDLGLATPAQAEAA